MGASTEILSEKSYNKLILRHFYEAKGLKIGVTGENLYSIQNYFHIYFCEVISLSA